MHELTAPPVLSCTAHLGVDLVLGSNKPLLASN